MSTESPPPTFGEQLRAARKRASLTQDEAAKMFGVSKSLWRQWEDGRSVPDNDATVITQERVISLISPNFPERLKAVRKFAKLTQTQAANLIGVSVVTLLNWEHNKRLPPQDCERISVERIFDVLSRIKIGRDT